MNIVFLGLSITSSWGNGHASTYRALVRALASRGHSIVFLERDLKWYSENRDLPSPPYCTTRLYTTVKDLERRHAEEAMRSLMTVTCLALALGTGARAAEISLYRSTCLRRGAIASCKLPHTSSFSFSCGSCGR